MDPATRNRILMVGGGLIVVALLMVCGPMQGHLCIAQARAQHAGQVRPHDVVGKACRVVANLPKLLLGNL